MRLATFVCVLAFVAIAVASAAGSFENVKVERAIALTSNIVRHFAEIEVTNTGSAAASEYTISLPAAQAANLAYLGVTDKQGNVLSVKTDATSDARSGFYSYAVTLASPLGPKASVNLRVSIVLTNALHPYPTEITQFEPQLVKYDDNIYFTSPYATREQRTTVRLASSVVKSFSEQRPTTRRGDEIVYGKYLNVEPFAEEPLSVHFENNSPFGAYDIVREFDISHWRAAISVEEQVVLRHNGAKLSTGFSRLDYQRMQAGVSSYRSVQAYLPAHAADVYFRDEIGNISSSSLREESTRQSLELRLRYPMFGGWSNSFCYGYNLPISDAVSVDSNGNYVFNISFGTHIEKAAADSLSLRIELPEGASLVAVQTPFAVQQSSGSYRSFLDIHDRTVVVLTRTPAVPEHNQHVQIVYSYSTGSALAKPLRLVLAFALCFGAAIVFLRMQLRISPVSSEKESHAQRTYEAATAFLAAARRACNPRPSSDHEAERKKDSELRREVESAARTLVEIDSAVSGLVERIQTAAESAMSSARKAQAAASDIARAAPLSAKRIELEAAVNADASELMRAIS